MQYIKQIIKFIRCPEMYISGIGLFFLKSVIITMCLSYLFSSFYPRYEFLDAKHRCDKISGKVEYYSDCSYDRGWK